MAPMMNSSGERRLLMLYVLEYVSKDYMASQKRDERRKQYIR